MRASSEIEEKQSTDNIYAFNVLLSMNSQCHVNNDEWSSHCSMVNNEIDLVSIQQNIVIKIPVF